MKTYKLVCQDCGGTLDANEDMNVLFCPYCGAKHMVEESDAIKKKRIDVDAMLKQQRAEIRHDLAKEQIKADKDVRKRYASVSELKMLIVFAAVCGLLALLVEGCEMIKHLIN